jgi:hypothetical protein
MRSINVLAFKICADGSFRDRGTSLQATAGVYSAPQMYF